MRRIADANGATVDVDNRGIGKQGVSGTVGTRAWVPKRRCNRTALCGSPAGVAPPLAFALYNNDLS